LTGKTRFLIRLLIEMLLRSKEVVFQFRNEVWLFTENGAYVLDPTVNRSALGRAAPTLAIILIDAGKGFTTPHPALVSQRFRAVLSSSPQESHWKDWHTDYMDHVYYTLDPFTAEELIQASVLLSFSFSIPS
jgi:hypothetical protein